MRHRERLAQLRRLARELDRLPPSNSRDALLREVRTRAVAVETADISHWPHRAPPNDRELLRQRLAGRQ